MFNSIGTADRAVHILIGIAMILPTFFDKVSAWTGWLELIPLVTDPIRTCPFYWILGIGRH